MKSSIDIYLKTFLVFAVATLVASCGSNNLGRPEAAEILDNVFAQSFKQSEGLDNSLREKPEFDSLKTLQFTTLHVEITGIHKVNETEANVEYKIITTGKKENLQKWLIAFGKLQQRLLALPMYAGQFRDNFDGQTFVPNAYYPAGFNITQTGAWQELQAKRISVNQLIQNGSVESKMYSATFLLYDDGWRVVTNR